MWAIVHDHSCKSEVDACREEHGCDGETDDLTLYCQHLVRKVSRLLIRYSHEERCLAEHVILHDHTGKIPQKFEDEATAHGKREAVGAAPDPEKELSKKKEGEDNGEKEV